MPLDYQQIREQVIRLGEKAPARQQELQEKRRRARELLESHARGLEDLRSKIQDVVRNYDPTLRCALPVSEPLDAVFSSPPLHGPVTIIAADGSQITPDRHAEVEYGLINVGAICSRTGSSEAPQQTIESELLFDEDLYNRTGMITEARLALLRDLKERTILADLAKNAAPPLVTFTDGPMELWVTRDVGVEATDIQNSLAGYLDALERLQQMGVVTAGYVDKPSASLVVRLLEIAALERSRLAEVREWMPLRGVTDRHLFSSLLGPGERSAVFALQSQSASSYHGPLALHFFYLNVGREGSSSLARVDVPAWVVATDSMLHLLHAVLVDQCRRLGARTYPYLLHRAHETARVALPEKEQVTQMVLQELLRRGVQVETGSQKQALKDSEGRTRYES
jgi:hypothetical protein